MDLFKIISLTYLISFSAFAEISPEELTEIFDNSSGEDVFCFSTENTSLPPDISKLLESLSSHGGSSHEVIRGHLASLTHKVNNVIEELDSHSVYYNRIKNLTNPNIFSGQERLSKYSGANANNIRFPKNVNTSNFFSELFHEIVFKTSQWNTIQLSRTDLFHAHIIVNHKENDIFLIFHAKEYPNDLIQFNPAQTALLKFLDETLDPSISIENPTKEFTRRNFVASLKRKKICGIDTSSATFSFLRDPSMDESTLNQAFFSENGSKGELAIVHYYPREGAPLFFDFLRGTGLTIRSLFKDPKLQQANLFFDENLRYNIHIF